jgi:hypothetical protein
LWTDVENDPVTYTTGPLPSWLTFDAATRTFSANPQTSGIEGLHTISVFATDDINLADHIEKTFTIEITNINSVTNEFFPLVR